MENAATTSLAALLQGINPAANLGQGANLAENQSVISSEQFGALLQQLLGGGESGRLDAQVLQQLLPQGGEILPQQDLGTALLDAGIAGGLPQGQALEILVQQFKQLGQSSTPTTAPVLPDLVKATQSSSSSDQALPPAILMKLAQGDASNLTMPLVAADTTLPSQSTPLPENILLHLKTKLAGGNEQGDKTSDKILIKPEGVQLSNEVNVADLFKTSLAPMMLRTSSPDAKDKETETSLISVLTGHHSTSGIGDSSVFTLKSVADGVATAPTKSSWATPLDLPMASPQWKADFGQRILMMTKEGVQTAELKLNPAHLGPIEVRITLNDDQATINFSANHTLTREAIESSMPRLRELFQSNGLMLADAQVSDQSPRDSQQRRQYEQQAMNGNSFALNDEDINLGMISRGSYASDQGLALAVDFYA